MDHLMQNARQSHATIDTPDVHNRDSFSISDLSLEFDVTARALRFYEDQGLIAPQRQGLSRIYSKRDRARLAWILRAKRVGFSLSEIREMIDLYDLNDGRNIQRRVTIEKCRNRIDLLKAQRDDIESAIHELTEFVDLVGKVEAAEKSAAAKKPLKETKMPAYQAPVRDTQFVINEVLNIERYANLPGFENASEDMIDAILTEGAKFVEGVLFPINQSGDLEGCTRHADGSVTTPEGFKVAYNQYCEGAWGTLSAPEQYGGQGLPHIVSMAFEEYMASSNMAFAMYPGLTHGAVSAILVKGSDEQKATYAPNMISGKWGGTMNLTEPHCGTDLGLIRTKAVPNGDGSHAITGMKIFISSGEHDLTENIIHLVLAKTPDAPDSVKGISLFIVPKFLVNEDGSLGARNLLSCGSIEHKMGIHANSTCVMNYDGATGYMVGEENKGLAAMFIMMNVARLGVGQQGLGIAEVAYQNAVHYAHDRRQGRALTGPQDLDQKADTLFVHPDVRRMLLDAKAFTEGMRALCLWAALQADLTHNAQTEEDRQLADDLMGLLTPVIKGYGTDKGYDVATNAQQVYGGHGYIGEWGMEQYVRDARITMIYEGANGVQAMDLVGRKLAQNGGRAVQAFFKIIDEECASAKSGALGDLAGRLEKANGEMKAATMWFMQNGMANPNNVGAGAHHYMHIMGIVALGLQWLRMAEAAQAALQSGNENKAFYETKLVTARYFAERYLPDCGSLRRKIEAGSEAIMALKPEMFAVA